MEQTLGKRISMHRKELGLKQDQLAEQIGVTAQAVSKWENDQSCPDITTLPRLARIFGITTDELLGIETPQLVHEAEIVTDTHRESETDGLHISKDGFEFKLDNDTRSGSIGIAVLVLAVGGLTLLSNLLSWDVSFWSILWPTALLVFGLFGIMPKFSFFRLGCLVFGGYFLLENLNILSFAFGWDLALPVILLLFGISLLVDALKKPKKHNKSNADTQVTYSTDEDFLNYVAAFGNDQRTVSMSRLTEGTINTSFGDFTVDLSDVEEVAEECNLSINCSFGELILLVPQKYQVQCTHRGSVVVTGHPKANPDGIICIDANVSMGNVEIKYS